MNLLKKLGRIFLVLTEEERYIDPKNIKVILFIALKEDMHFEKALEVTKKRFPLAEIKDIHSNIITDIIKNLWELRREQFSMVLVLSLHPVIIFFVHMLFHCYFLIYNKFDQWFLIRKKTLYEFLAGRRGADKLGLDWEISPLRFSLAKYIAFISFLPFFIIRNAFRFIILITYIIINLLQLTLRRFYYKLANLERA